MPFSMSVAHAVIAESIDYLVAHYAERPSLEALAARAGYETTYFQKLFKEYVGLSPKQLCQFMHARWARELLADGAPTLLAAHASGLSGNARLHDLFVTLEGVTPGQVQGRGAGLTITYGFAPSIIGEVMIAKTARGVCWLGFLVDESRAEVMRRVRAHWPLAQFSHDDAAIHSDAAQILNIWAGKAGGNKLKLDLYGTNFQIQVWQALLKIPGGETLTYMDVAKGLGRPKSSRAVGNAVGANPVSLLIPCHRVIRASGIIDNYGWGSPRKKLILGLENLHNMI